MKTIVFGIDGADPELLEKWMGEGELPNLERMSEDGVFSDLETTKPPLTPSAWSSFMTGTNPGKHGIYDFTRLNEEKELVLNDAEERDGKVLWEILGRNGFDCGVFNVPFTYPPKEIEGFLVSGFTTPSSDSDFAKPQCLEDVILDSYPDFKFNEEGKYTENREDKLDFRDEAFDLAEKRFELFEELKDLHDLDFGMIVFNLTDHMQHWYWKYMDRSHPKYRDDPEFEDTILESYKRVDNYLGDLREQHPKANIIVMSDHGFGPYYKDVSMNQWLKEKGYLSLKESSSPLKKIAEVFGTDKLISLGLNTGLWSILKRFDYVRETIREKMMVSYQDIDWDETVAYSHGYYGPIYLNEEAVDNEDLGVLKEEIKEEISEIRNPVNDGSLMSDIWYREELYSGDRVEDLPEIVLNMNDYSFGSSSKFPFSSNSIFSDPKTFKTGDHRLNGAFLAAGPNISQENLDNPSILDVAPTVLEIMGVDVPDRMDGNVLEILQS